MVVPKLWTLLQLMERVISYSRCVGTRSLIKNQVWNSEKSKIIHPERRLTCYSWNDSFQTRQVFIFRILLSINEFISCPWIGYFLTSLIRRSSKLPKFKIGNPRWSSEYLYLNTISWELNFVELADNKVFLDVRIQMTERPW